MRSALNEKELDQLRALLDKLRAGLES
jgi:hypothetical protein